MTQKGLFKGLSLLAISMTGCTQSGGWGTASAPKDMQSTPLIARDVFFGNPDRAGTQISPDGTHLAFLAESNGVMNVWIAPISDPNNARVVTDDKVRGIRSYQWAYDNDHILYIQDKGGDENWHVYATNLKSNETRDLTPMDGVQARIQEKSDVFPGELLLAINDRDKQFHDIYRVNIATGDRKLVQQNDGYVAFLSDGQFNIRYAMRMTPDGGMDVFKPSGGDWTLSEKIPAEDSLTTQPIGFDKSGKTLYQMDSRGRDTAGLFAINVDTNEKQMLAADPKADAGGILAHPVTGKVQAVAFNYERQHWTVLDDAIKSDMKYLEEVADGELNITSRSHDDNHWVVAYVMDNGPVRYYYYDRPAKKAKFLFTNRKKLEGLPLAKMHPVVIKSRDGMNLVSYLSIPAWADKMGDGHPGHPLPLVLNVHGGPWARDDWGLDPEHQWLTNRGYAVLSVNYRGSTGLGKNFINAGNMQWAAAMHNDLLDAVDWAVKEKIADPAKVAIYGGSYGGYATLVGMTFTPDEFCCGVDIVGPSNLVTLLNSIPPYWKPMVDMFTSRVGDHRTAEGKKLLEERSPLNHVDQIKKPLLIAQGANDPRVKQAEADQIVNAMQQKNIPVTYVLFPDEGHGFARPQNRTAFYAVVEEFLAKQLGGRFEPVGDDFEGSSITVPQGMDQLPGLKKSLAKS